jgi:hypothetical protein
VFLIVSIIKEHRSGNKVTLPRQRSKMFFLNLGTKFRFGTLLYNACCVGNPVFIAGRGIRADFTARDEDIVMTRDMYKQTVRQAL